jgi:hypothetical protein
MLLLGWFVVWAGGSVGLRPGMIGCRKSAEEVGGRARELGDARVRRRAHK